MREDADKGQMAIWAVAAVLLAFALYRLLGGDGEAAGRAPPVRVDGGGAAPAERKASGAYVHVAGAVRRPGLYRVPVGSRVGAAVARAGGPSRRADLTRVNLAQPVTDGQQVVVPRRGEAAAPAVGAGAAPGGVATAPAPGPISLATATVEQLDTLDGIGPTLAQRILEHRDRIGGFKSVDQLREVEGIGEKRFEALKGALAP